MPFLPEYPLEEEPKDYEEDPDYNNDVELSQQETDGYSESESSTDDAETEVTENQETESQDKLSEERRTAKKSSSGGFSFWTFAAGLLMGVCLIYVGQICVTVYKKRRNPSYNEPFSFDDFVNN